MDKKEEQHKISDDKKLIPLTSSVLVAMEDFNTNEFDSKKNMPHDPRGESDINAIIRREVRTIVQEMLVSAVNGKFRETLEAVLKEHPEYVPLTEVDGIVKRNLANNALNAEYHISNEQSASNYREFVANIEKIQNKIRNKDESIRQTFKMLSKRLDKLEKKCNELKELTGKKSVKGYCRKIHISSSDSDSSSNQFSMRDGETVSFIKPAGNVKRNRKIEAADVGVARLERVKGLNPTDEEVLSHFNLTNLNCRPRSERYPEPTRSQLYYEHRQYAVNMLFFKKSEYSLQLNHRNRVSPHMFEFKELAACSDESKLEKEPLNKKSHGKKSKAAQFANDDNDIYNDEVN